MFTALFSLVLSSMLFLSLHLESRTLPKPLTQKEEKEEFEMGIPNGVGEQMLAHAFEQFDIKLEQTEFGPKIIGEYDELVKARDFLENAIRERLKELEGE